MAKNFVHRHAAVERRPLGLNGRMPKAVIRFKLGGEEVAHISTNWIGRALQAQFVSSREDVKRLAAVIKAFGDLAGDKPIGAGWAVKLYADGKKPISEDRSKQGNIETSPNAAEFGSAEYSVNCRGGYIDQWRRGKPKAQYSST